MPALYEIMYNVFEYCLPMYPIIRKIIKGSALKIKKVGKIQGGPILLDVGGRRSGYTCGVDANVYIKKLSRFMIRSSYPYIKLILFYFISLLLPIGLFPYRLLSGYGTVFCRMILL